jgi:hypothetical protein
MRRFFAPTLLRAWLMAGLLLAAQAAGLAHRIAHAPGQAGAHASWSHGHEAGGADCRLIDQLAHADALCSPPAWAPAPPPPAAAPLRLAIYAALAPAPAAYLARAPPRG